jgi:hypothetical protein
MEPPTPDPTPTPTAHPEPVEGIPAQDPVEALRAELEATRATLAGQLTEAQAAATLATQERDSALAQHSELETRNSELSAAALTAHRRAVLAENAGTVIPELVLGSSEAEIDASIETAKAAYARVVDAVKALAPTPVPVPPGASPRSEPEPESLSPLQKITGALSRNGR